MTTRWSLKALVCLIYFGHGDGLAANHDLLTSPTNMALGNSATATPGATFAAEANPAGLTLLDRPSISAHASYSSLNLNPLAPDNSGQLPQTNDRQDDQSLQGIGFGIHIPLPFKVHLGATGYLPEDFLKVHVMSGEEHSYLNFSERNQKPNISTALAVGLPMGLALGAGFYHTLETNGQVQLSLSDQDTRGRATIGVKPVRIPYAGLRWQHQLDPQSFFALGGVYREASKTSAEVATQIIVDTAQFSVPADAEAEFALFYEPQIVKVGAHFQSPAFALMVDYQESRWSKYKPPFFSIESTALVAQDFKALEFQDTRSYKVGAEFPHTLMPSFHGFARVGYQHHTSAMSKAPQNTAVVDTPRDIYALGYGVKSQTKDGEQLTVDIAWQTILMRDTEFLSTVGNQTLTAGGRATTVVGGISYDL